MSSLAQALNIFFKICDNPGKVHENFWIFSPSVLNQRIYYKNKRKLQNFAIKRVSTVDIWSSLPISLKMLTQ